MLVEPDEVPIARRVRCPACGSADVRSSHDRGNWDAVLEALFKLEAFRCRSCRRRFHKQRREERERGEP